MADTTFNPQSSAEPKFMKRVVVTGASGFVGRHLVRELVARGHRPVCLVRDRDHHMAMTDRSLRDRIESVACSIFDRTALAKAMQGADAIIHLVGIIFEHRLKGQTFERVHVEATRNVLEAANEAGVRRYLHMSALGARPNAASKYHQTKWEAEGLVGESGLDWTIFRPSIIHGPDGEFMQMMKMFVCRAWVPAFGFIPSPFPVIPYFGDGSHRVQPVDVRDVARCFVTALSAPHTIGRAFELGGPESYNWKELYRICRSLIPGAKRWKPIVGIPVWKAKMMAATLMKLAVLPNILRFNEGQVQMSQEDSTCDSRLVEETFAIRLRNFREELAAYAAMID